MQFIAVDKFQTQTSALVTSFVSRTPSLIAAFAEVAD